ncbi:DUF4919 domain-containing protein [Mangrovivirga sp. M17]|uniref:DUF4919 domain-containing protein n=1 Tax=Mangrovivirga halotolerans TaxID=2993936 RepID=A0ABT3RNX4_9BACT|nr:DUF4919 domain-containing protein [Mangrovivirga halotolerans]MCX2743310.1 DUF4919 domain-containing protein [Mangrovivirga halotolerans]
MRIIIFIILSLFTIAKSYSQQNDFLDPDYEAIQKSINNVESPFYFEHLMSQFEKGDSTMSLQEKRHLYYGYSFHPDYSPYSRSVYLDSINVILSRSDSAIINNKKFLIYSDSALSDNPFNLFILDKLYYYHKAKGNNPMAEIILAKINIILDAMLSTGDGITRETAIHVIYTSHEYFVINVFGLEYGGKQKNIDNYDFLSVQDNEFQLKGLIFNITPLYRSTMNDKN